MAIQIGMVMIYCGYAIHEGFALTLHMKCSQSQPFKIYFLHEYVFTGF